MVTPAALKGAGCADAALMASVEANTKATNIFVLTDSSLLSWISSCLELRDRCQPATKLSARWVLKKRKMAVYSRFPAPISSKVVFSFVPSRNPISKALTSPLTIRALSREATASAIK